MKLRSKHLVDERRPRRRGSSLAEAILALFLIGGVVAGLAPLLAKLGLERRQAVDRATALHELENQLEELTSLSWNELTAERLADRALSPSAASQLRGAKLAVDVTEHAGPPVARRISLAVTLTGRQGEPGPTLRLTGWVFASRTNGGAP